MNKINFLSRSGSNTNKCTCCQASCSRGDFPAMKCPGVPEAPCWCSGARWCGGTGEYWDASPEQGWHTGSEVFVSLWVGAAAAIWGPRKSSLGVACSAATPKLPGTLWENCKCLLLHFMLWILSWRDAECRNSAPPELSLETLATSGVWIPAALYRARAFRLLGGTAQKSAVQTSRWPFNFSLLPELIKLSRQGCCLLKIHLVKTFLVQNLHQRRINNRFSLVKASGSHPGLAGLNCFANSWKKA